MCNFCNCCNRRASASTQPIGAPPPVMMDGQAEMEFLDSREPVPRLEIEILALSAIRSAIKNRLSSDQGGSDAQKAKLKIIAQALDRGSRLDMEVQERRGEKITQRSTGRKPLPLNQTETQEDNKVYTIDSIANSSSQSKAKNLKSLKVTKI